VVETTPPAAPTVDTSDPDMVTGKTDVGATVTVKDPDGTTLCAAQTGSDGSYACHPTRPLQPGDEITVAAADQDGNAAATTVRVLSVEVHADNVTAGETQTATGRYFQPGEKVTAVMHSTPVTVAETVADAAGNVTVAWTIPAGTALGTHTIELTGAVSGPGRAAFQVQEAAPEPKPDPVKPMPSTGAGATLHHAAVGFTAVLLGLALIVWALRRRRGQA
jgi:hypothetical protein